MPISLVADGKVRDLSFRLWKEMSHEDHKVWHFYVGEECWGFVVPSHAWKDKWEAWSYNQECPKQLRHVGGFATRLDAGTFIVKTYGYWEND